MPAFSASGRKNNVSRNIFLDSYHVYLLLGFSDLPSWDINRGLKGQENLNFPLILLTPQSQASVPCACDTLWSCPPSCYFHIPKMLLLLQGPSCKPCLPPPPPLEAAKNTTALSRARLPASSGCVPGCVPTSFRNIFLYRLTRAFTYKLSDQEFSWLQTQMFILAKS